MISELLCAGAALALGVHLTSSGLSAGRYLRPAAVPPAPLPRANDSATASVTLTPDERSW